MKKILAFILIICSLFMISCSSNKILVSATYQNSSCIEINKEQLEDKIENDDFILYIYTDGCTSCFSFETYILNNYIEETSADIYKISYTQIDGLISTSKRMQTNPRIIIFKDGKIYQQVNYTSNEKVFTDLNKFKTYIEKYCVISSLKEVNYSQLQDLLNDNTDKIIYYHWSSCGDCTYFENNYLKEYLLKNKIDNFYSFEVSEFRQYKLSEDDSERQIYYDFLELAKYEINENKGVVPTTIYLHNNQVSNYSIYFNDTFEFSSDGKVTVVKTAYNETDASICKTYNSYADYQKQSANYHNNKFVSFMNSTNLVK